jgi:CRISPR-associated protein Cas1
MTDSTTESPPLEPVEHPTDLVIDQFGVCLGRRSERMLVRWREPTSPKPPRILSLHNAGQSEREERVPSPESSRYANWIRQVDEAAEVSVAPPASPGTWNERQIPLHQLRSVIVAARGITISSDLIESLVNRGIALSFLTGQGEPVAQLVSPALGGTVLTRRAQLSALNSPKGVELAIEFVRGKLRNQRHILQYFGKYLRTKAPDRFEPLLRKIDSLRNLRKRVASFTADRLDSLRDELMGHEGVGARLYWEGVAMILQEHVAFPGRQTRGALDPVNSALNYGYGILYSQVSAALANAGLELYAGFLHVDRPGKPSLVLDLVEEFRAPVVDRAILAAFNQGAAIETDAHGLMIASRRLIADRVLANLATAVPYEGKRWALAKVIQHQARHLAVAIRGERTYRSFASRW